MGLLVLWTTRALHIFAFDLENEFQDHDFELEDELFSMGMEDSNTPVSIIHDTAPPECHTAALDDLEEEDNSEESLEESKEEDSEETTLHPSKDCQAIDWEQDILLLTSSKLFLRYARKSEFMMRLHEVLEDHVTVLNTHVPLEFTLPTPSILGLSGYTATLMTGQIQLHGLHSLNIHPIQALGPDTLKFKIDAGEISAQIKSKVRFTPTRASRSSNVPGHPEERTPQIYEALIGFHLRQPKITVVADVAMYRCAGSVIDRIKCIGRSAWSLVKSVGLWRFPQELLARFESVHLQRLKLDFSQTDVELEFVEEWRGGNEEEEEENEEEENEEEDDEGDRSSLEYSTSLEEQGGRRLRNSQRKYKKKQPSSRFRIYDSREEEDEDSYLERPRMVQYYHEDESSEHWQEEERSQDSEEVPVPSTFDRVLDIYDWFTSPSSQYPPRYHHDSRPRRPQKPRFRTTSPSRRYNNSPKNKKAQYRNIDRPSPGFGQKMQYIFDSKDLRGELYHHVTQTLSGELRQKINTILKSMSPHFQGRCYRR